ncbi:hypothetical protein AB0L65_32920 [Nonomuraea sp. NPDC052116]|uniref:hypothetical protein n=1 Tax=Nonomuraea sp. NPDC052116 TaxID=3155665 RepID=UPI00343AEFEF
MATQPPSPESRDHTPYRKFRLPDTLWEAYGSVCARVFSRERSEDLVEHIRTVISEYGDADELAKLETAEQEMAERRARKGGRPRKQPASESE